MSKKSNDIDYLIKHYEEVFNELESTDDDKFITPKNVFVFFAALIVLVATMFGVVNLFFSL